MEFALIPNRAERFNQLIRNERGRRKFLASLHSFERAIRLAPAVSSSIDRTSRCFAFHPSIGFGAEYQSVTGAYEQLSLLDGWLIVVHDGSGAIYRPEARWDDEVEISRLHSGV